MSAKKDLSQTRLRVAHRRLELVDGEYIILVLPAPLTGSARTISGHVVSFVHVPYFAWGHNDPCIAHGLTRCMEALSEKSPQQRRVLQRQETTTTTTTIASAERNIRQTTTLFAPIHLASGIYPMMLPLHRRIFHHRSHMHIVVSCFCN